jgi:hypothetical protein
LRIAAVGGDKALGNGEAPPVTLQRLVELALLRQYVAQIRIGNHEVALPTGVAAIGGGEALADGKALSVALEGFVKLALLSEHHDAKLGGLKNSFGPGLRLELFENRGNVKLHRMKGNPKATSDLLVGKAICHRG